MIPTNDSFFAYGLLNWQGTSVALAEDRPGAFPRKSSVLRCAFTVIYQRLASTSVKSTCT